MPKYCLVGYLHSNPSRSTNNIIGGRVIDLKTLKFSNIEISKLISLVEGKECVGIQHKDSGDNENFYVMVNGKEKYIKEYGCSNIIIGKAKNCYIGTDGNEYIKLLDIEDICETDSLCREYTVKASNISVFKCNNCNTRNNREIKYINGDELDLFPEYKSSKIYKTTEINNRLMVMDAGYYVTSNLDVIVTNANRLRLITDKGLIKTIGKYGGFKLCENLNTVRLGDSVKFIYDYAFYKCPNLKKLYLGRSVKYIGDQAFGFCESLEEVKLHEGVVQISSMAFSNCTNLKKITIPKSVKQMQPNSFINCPNLREIVVSTERHKRAFEDCRNNSYINEHTKILLEVNR